MGRIRRIRDRLRCCVTLMAQSPIRPLGISIGSTTVYELMAFDGSSLGILCMSEILKIVFGYSTASMYSKFVPNIQVRARNFFRRRSGTACS
jgi:hypothetical protein